MDLRALVVVLAALGAVEGLNLLEAWLRGSRSSSSSSSSPTAGYVLQQARRVTSYDRSRGHDAYDYDYNGDESRGSGYHYSSDDDNSVQRLYDSGDDATAFAARNNTPEYPHNSSGNYGNRATHNDYYSRLLRHFYSKYDAAVRQGDNLEHLPKSRSAQNRRQDLYENSNSNHNQKLDRTIDVGQSDDTPSLSYLRHYSVSDHEGHHTQPRVDPEQDEYHGSGLQSKGHHGYGGSWAVGPSRRVASRTCLAISSDFFNTHLCLEPLSVLALLGSALLLRLLLSSFLSKACSGRPSDSHDRSVPSITVFVNTTVLNENAFEGDHTAGDRDDENGKKCRGNKCHGNNKDSNGQGNGGKTSERSLPTVTLWRELLEEARVGLLRVLLHDLGSWSDSHQRSLAIDVCQWFRG